MLSKGTSDTAATGSFTKDVNLYVCFIQNIYSSGVAWGGRGAAATPDWVNRCPSRKFRNTSYVL